MDWLKSMGGCKRPKPYIPYVGKDHPNFTNFQDMPKFMLGQKLKRSHHFEGFLGIKTKTNV